MIRRLLVLTAAVFALGAVAFAQDPPAGVDDGHGHDHAAHAGHAADGERDRTPLPSEPRAREWPAEAVAALARLPLQDGGRVKPLSTFADYELLQLNGKRTVTLDDADETRLQPMQWLLDVLFRPDVAIGHRCFVVDEGQALEAIGLHIEGRKRRDRFSFAELVPYADEIGRLNAEFETIEVARRSPLQGQIVTLWTNLNDFNDLLRHGEVFGGRYALQDAPRFEEVFGAAAPITLADVLANWSPVQDVLQRIANEVGDGTSGSAHGQSPDGELMAALWMRQMMSAASMQGHTLALFPPSHGVEEAPEYLTYRTLIQAASEPGAAIEPQIDLVRELNAMAEAAADGNDDAFTEHALRLVAGSTALAERREEAGKIGLEVTYHRAQFVYYSLIVYMLGFLLCATSWVWPTTRWLKPAIVACVVSATAYLTVGIVLRCIIRERPPVSTLYETILFITSTGVIACLVAEWLVPRRIALAISAVLGAAGMFLAYKFEIDKAVDTMPTLVAVLDTNFWLATHVTTVTIGYAAGLFAGAAGHVYVLGKVFGLKRNDPGFYKAVGRIVYGLIAFGLVFSVVGTVLGGIWANDSWGRFWGWDPKENGALMIVLMNLIILHGRLGGYIRDYGMALLSVVLAAVVAFSWWHVNLLGVGLHSYGFTANVKSVLFGFYGLEALVVATGLGYAAFLHLHGPASAGGKEASAE